MNTRRLAVAALCAVPVLALAGSRLFAAQSLPYPETQKLVIDNMFVRVFDIRVPPGVTEARHSHAHGVTVALTDYDAEARADGGQWIRTHARAGDVRWNEPVTHEARNVGTTEQHVIRIELK